MKREESCSTCRAFDAIASCCRRNAPVMFPVPQHNAVGQITSMQAMGLWPATNKDGWCLEYVAAPPVVAPH